jgi:GNAT superfamily N-acetyltransferase
MNSLLWRRHLGSNHLDAVDAVTPNRRDPRADAGASPDAKPPHHASASPGSTTAMNIVTSTSRSAGALLRAFAPIARIDTRFLGPEELPAEFDTLVKLLRSAVNDGAWLGFVSPLSERDARAYWQSVHGEIEQGDRVLVVARQRGGIVGAGQLSLPRGQHARHRARIHKLIVTASMQGRGIGGLLMERLHGRALAHGRSLIVLSTQRGSGAEAFYRRLGYQMGGVIPDFSRAANNEPRDIVTLFRHLAY